MDSHQGIQKPPNIIQSFHYPSMVTFPCQSFPRIPIPYLEPAIQSLYAQPKHPASFELIANPTKRIKQTLHSFIESAFNLEEVPHITRCFENRILSGNSHDILRNAENNTALTSARQYAELMEDNRTHHDALQKENIDVVNFGENLEIPETKELRRFPEGETPVAFSDVLRTFKNQEISAYESARFGYQNQALTIMHLEQQKAKYELQRQVLQQLERQHQQFGNFIQQQLAQHQQYRQYQKTETGGNMSIYHMQEAHNTNITGSNYFYKGMNFQGFHNGNNAESVEVKVDDDYQQVKVEHANGDTMQYGQEKNNVRDNTKQEEEAEKAELVRHKKVVEKKKEQKKKPASKKAPASKGQEKPRRRNKWQRMVRGQEADNEQELPADNSECTEETNVEEKENVEVPLEPKVKEPKQMEIPQHMQNDSSLNFEYLMSLTITNDPIYVGGEKSDFVVINKNNKVDDSNNIKQARIGSRYQAIPPVFNQKALNSKKRCPQIAWVPGTLGDREIEEYFSELSRVLKCQRNMIHEERALKLLNRKNWNKEKVRVNICKNEKFYASSLLAIAAFDSACEDKAS